MKGVRIPFRSEDRLKEKRLGFISRRLDFDGLFASEMKKYSEIRLMEDYEARSFTFSDGHWIITPGSNTDGRHGNPEITARLIIAADGANSRFANQVGGRTTDPEHYGAGIRAYYSGVEGLDPDGYIELYFLKSILPGYLWIFPLPDGTVNTGIWTRNDLIRITRLNLKSELHSSLHTLPGLKERFADARMVVPPGGFTLPLGSGKEKLSGPGYMLVGDAACLIDPFTGEGIGNAMVSGSRASEHALRCIQSNDFSEDMLRSYDTHIQSLIGRELRLGRRLQKLARHPQLINFIAGQAQKNGIVFKTLNSIFQNFDRTERSIGVHFFIRLLRQSHRRGGPP
jgi:flavin-dependent dehydrogenase